MWDAIPGIHIKAEPEIATDRVSIPPAMSGTPFIYTPDASIPTIQT